MMRKKEEQGTRLIGAGGAELVGGHWGLVPPFCLLGVGLQFSVVKRGTKTNFNNPNRGEPPSANMKTRGRIPKPVVRSGLASHYSG